MVGKRPGLVSPFACRTPPAVAIILFAMVSMCSMGVSITQLSGLTALLLNPTTSPTGCLTTSSSLCIGLHCTSTSRRQLESSHLTSSASSHRTRELYLSVQRPARLPERQRRIAVSCSGAAEEIETEKPIELPIFPSPLALFPQRSTYNNRKDIFRSDAVFKAGALQRLSEILVGSALLIATLGLGFTRPAFACPSTVETSSNVLNEELNSDKTITSETAPESESTPSQSTKEEERDPAELVLLSYLGGTRRM